MEDTVLWRETVSNFRFNDRRCLCPQCQYAGLMNELIEEGVEEEPKP